MLDIKNEIAHIVREELSSRKNSDDLSMREFCKRAGMHPPQLFRVLKGENYTIDSLIKILMSLDLEIKIK